MGIMGAFSHMSIEERKRSSRQRTSTAKVRVFDAATRAEIQRKKLAALEADNWVEERPKDDDDDDEYNPLADADSGDEVAVDAPKRKNRKKKAKNDKFSAAQKCKTLQAHTKKTNRIAHGPFRGLAQRYE